MRSYEPILTPAQAISLTEKEEETLASEIQTINMTLRKRFNGMDPVDVTFTSHSYRVRDHLENWITSSGHWAITKMVYDHMEPNMTREPTDMVLGQGVGGPYRQGPPGPRDGAAPHARVTLTALNPVDVVGCGMG